MKRVGRFVFSKIRTRKNREKGEKKCKHCKFFPELLFTATFK
jgi:hypothetical protein